MIQKTGKKTKIFIAMSARLISSAQYQRLARSHKGVRWAHTNEVVRPGHRTPAAVLRLPARLGRVHVAVDDHDPHGAEGVRDDGPLRRAHDVVLAREDQHQRAADEHAQAQQEGAPEAHVALHVGRGEQRQAAHVDRGVEDHVDALVGHARVQDDALAGRARVHRLELARVLVRDERRDIGLNPAGA